MPLRLCVSHLTSPDLASYGGLYSASSVEGLAVRVGATGGYSVRVETLGAVLSRKYEQNPQMDVQAWETGYSWQ